MADWLTFVFSYHQNPHIPHWGKPLTSLFQLPNSQKLIWTEGLISPSTLLLFLATPELRGRLVQGNCESPAHVFHLWCSCLLFLDRYSCFWRRNLFSPCHTWLKMILAQTLKKPSWHLPLPKTVVDSATSSLLWGGLLIKSSKLREAANIF